ncbi:hypothetical protein B0T14DRAFT_278920 [Immersiella caudata]|uniref:Uncharacterized protein n=1 Tax=Immersiella caudata TaxID=314043 RepID=A0AA39WDK5_9PEZI|nr:hypothetical protein B0T14DRAFT_278920 [Immersiella caudata]
MSEPEFGPGGPPAFSSDSSPWVWVLIPVGIVVAIGALAVCLHSKRRNRLASYLHSTAPSPPPNAQPPGGRSRAINERELEEAWVRGAPPTSQHTIPAPGGRWANTGTGSRWYWAGSEQRRARPEEGLNELGEAPPPYEKAKKSPPSPPPPLNLNGEGRAPKSGPASSAPSLHRGSGIGAALSFESSEEMEMHTLAPAITGRTLTTIATGQSTASSVSDGVRRSMGDPLSPFTLSSIPSTAASSIHERGLSPPPYDGVPAPMEGTVELSAPVPMELAGVVPVSATFPPAAWVESVDGSDDEGEDEVIMEEGNERSSAAGSSATSVSGVLTPPEPAVLAANTA